jgi:MerR family regulatory protein
MGRTVSASGLRSGELAAATGVNVQTLRYYERRGLLGLRARAAIKLGEVEAKLAELAAVRETLRAALDAGSDNSKRWWTLPLGLGALLYIGACALALLAAAGIAAACEWRPGAPWLEPIGVALVVISIIGTALAYRRARRCATPLGRADGSEQGRGCGTSTNRPAEVSAPPRRTNTASRVGG